MNSLGDFLDRFKSLLLAPGAVKKPIIQTINKFAQVELTEKEVDIREGIIYIKTHPLVKNEIFMRKASILKELEAFLGAKSPKDIR